MFIKALRSFSILFWFTHFTALCYAQQEWNIPWTVVGDSTRYSQNEMIIVTGHIFIKGSSNPVSGATISSDFHKYFDHSDNYGRYFLEMPSGRYRITIKHIGFKTQYIRLIALANGVLNVELEEGSTNLDEVIVQSRPIDSNVKDPMAGLTKLEIQEVRSLPTLMGEVDILKSLQLMPGVSSVGEGSSGLNVRGGRTDQNLILLNGAPLFSTTHALGFVSGFNQDVIRDFSLYKGNVPSQYGGRAASVLEINTRRSTAEKWQFAGGAGLITSRLLAEGPVHSSNTSLMISGRSSYSNWLLKKVEDPNVKKSKVSFYDLFMSLNHKFSENSGLDLTFYSSDDLFQFSDQFGYSWTNHLIHAKWQAAAKSKASPVLSASYGSFKNTLIDPSGVDASELSNTMSYLQVKQVVNYLPKENHIVIAGIEGTVYMPEPENIVGYKGNPAIQMKSVAKDRGSEFALFINDEFKASENFSISAGLRYSHYIQMGPDTVFRYAAGLPKSVNSIQDTSYFKSNKKILGYGGFEPRISMRISLNSNQSLKIGYARMRQYIHQVSNTTAPTPVDLWQLSNTFLPPQIADNFSVGYFKNIRDNRWETSMEIFYKEMENLVEYKDFPKLFLNNHLETELLSGRGLAYGGEVFIRRIKGKWTGWASYTYSQTRVKVSSSHESESINDGSWFPSNYNKPHTINLVLNRKLEKNGAFSLLFSYNTGRPLTAIESTYIVDGTVVPVYSERNKYKIPDYIRLDLSLTIGTVFRKFDDSLALSVYNLFGRENAYSVFYQRPQSNFLIPKPYKLSVLGSAFPSLTYNFRF